MQTDRVIIEARRPDNVFVDKENRKCQISDLIVQNDEKVNMREGKKKREGSNYRNLVFEIQRLCNVRVKRTPVVTVVFGIKFKDL